MAGRPDRQTDVSAGASAKIDLAATAFLYYTTLYVVHLPTVLLLYYTLLLSVTAIC